MVLSYETSFPRHMSVGGFRQLLLMAVIAGSPTCTSECCEFFISNTNTSGQHCYAADESAFLTHANMLFMQDIQASIDPYESSCPESRKKDSFLGNVSMLDFGFIPRPYGVSHGVSWKVIESPGSRYEGPEFPTGQDPDLEMVADLMVNSLKVLQSLVMMIYHLVTMIIHVIIVLIMIITQPILATANEYIRALSHELCSLLLLVVSTWLWTKYSESFKVPVRPGSQAQRERVTYSEIRPEQDPREYIGCRVGFNGERCMFGRSGYTGSRSASKTRGKDNAQLLERVQSGRPSWAGAKSHAQFTYDMVPQFTFIFGDAMKFLTHQTYVWYYGSHKTIEVNCSDGTHSITAYGEHDVTVGAVFQFLQIDSDVAYATYGSKHIMSIRMDAGAMLFDGDVITVRYRMKGGTVKTPKPKPPPKPKPTKQPGAATFDDGDADPELQAFVKTVDLVTKMTMSERVENKILELMTSYHDLMVKFPDNGKLLSAGILLDQHLLATPAASGSTPGPSNNNDQRPPAQPRENGTCPKSKSSFSSHDYTTYRQELCLWWKCNEQLAANHKSLCILNSMDESTKRTVQTTMQSQFQGDVELVLEDLLKVLDTNFHRSQPAETALVISELKTFRQGNDSMATALQKLRNVIIRAKLQKYSPASDFASSIVQMFHLNLEQRGKILAALRDHSAENVTKDQFELGAYALEQIDQISDALELAKAFREGGQPPQSRRQRVAAAAAAHAEEAGAANFENPGKGAKFRGKGKGKGNGKFGGGKGAGKFGGHGKGAKTTIQKIQKVQKTYPRSRPPDAWSRERDWQCKHCSAFNFKFEKDMKTIRRICFFCKLQKASGRDEAAEKAAEKAGAAAVAENAAVAAAEKMFEHFQKLSTQALSSQPPPEASKAEGSQSQKP